MEHIAAPVARTGSIQSGRFRLGYSVEGTGKPLLVVGSAVYYPRTFSASLRQHFQLVCVDHRGFAPAPADSQPSDFDLEVLVDDIELMRQHLGLDQVIIAGHSGHGYLALEYAKKYPQHVTHVAMIATPPDLSAHSRDLAERYWQESVWPERKQFFAQSMQELHEEFAHAELTASQRFIRYLVKSGARQWYDFRYDATPLWAGITWNTVMADYVWGTVFRDIDITQGLEKFDKSVFLVLGRYDFNQAPPSAWDPLRSHFKQLIVRVFEHSGHNPQLEEQAHFDAQLLEWMRSV